MPAAVLLTMIPENEFKRLSALPASDPLGLTGGLLSERTRDVAQQLIALDCCACDICCTDVLSASLDALKQLAPPKGE